MRKPLKEHLRRVWKGWGREILIVLAIVIPLRSSVADWHDVPSGSMRPTIIEGDRIFVNKLAYDLKIPLTTWHLARWGGPQRGDIVICYSPANGTRLVKRIVGIPGDRIALRDNRLTINNKPVQYGPLEQKGDTRTVQGSQSVFPREDLTGKSHAIQIIPARPARRSFAPVMVPPGQFLVLGDNRDDSADSRYFGFVERSQVVGRVRSVVFSLDPDHWPLPRQDRWFKSLD